VAVGAAFTACISLILGVLVFLVVSYYFELFTVAALFMRAVGYFGLRLVDFLLNGDMEFDDVADEDKLLAQASDMIPTCIAGIHEIWRKYRKPPSPRGRRRLTEGQAGKRA
jgi:hypothetical protein